MKSHSYVSVSVDGVLGLNILRNVILSDQFSSTKQFWAEVSKEIDSLQISVTFTALKNLLYGRNGTYIDNILDVSFNSISSRLFDGCLLPYLKTISSELTSAITSGSLLKKKVDSQISALKPKLESGDSRGIIGSLHTKESTVSRKTKTDEHSCVIDANKTLTNRQPIKPSENAESVETVRSSHNNIDKLKQMQGTLTRGQTDATPIPRLL
ncbi:hypothetical protein DPMN_070495 [Dreissena polymorpha]|uniref:Uncharacterized protein n=1 Tax=Dreissena polymorpha TaxID=45954 RepID=A0A9D3Z573_DREPO|nr:hypothetical protein DPMN_070495 [Dreissena polymorpha]